MSENNNSFEKPKEKIDMMSILQRVDSVSHEDRQNFKRRILPDFMGVFDDMSDSDQDMLVFLDSCSDEELIYLIAHDETDGRALAIHDIDQHLQKIELLLCNGRMEQLKKQMESE